MKSFSSQNPHEMPTGRQGARAAIVTRLDVEPSEHMRPLSLSIILRLFSHVRPYHSKFRLLLFCVLLRSIQLPALAWAIAAVINGPISDGNIPGIFLGTLGFGLLILFTQVVLRFRQLYSLQLGELVIRDLRLLLYEHLHRMPMAFFHRMRLGRLISRMTSDIEAVRVGVQEVFFVSIVGIGQMAVAGAVMLWCDPFLFSLVLAMAPVIWFLNHTFRGRISYAHRQMQESFSRLTSTLAESVNGMRTTQGFARQEINAELFRALVEDHSRYNLGAARTTGIFLPLLELNSQVFTAVLLLVGGFRVLSPTDAMPLTDLILFLFLAAMFFDPIKTIGTQYTRAMESMAGAERVFRLLDAKPDWEDDSDARAVSIQGKVEFRGVEFAYQPDRPVLEDVNFKVEAGQSVALVGATGSGKTSIINLITKFYLPTSGSIWIDGIDLRKISSQSLRQQLGMVPQQNFLFHGSVLENIRLGKVDATDEEVREAAKGLDVLDLLEALPEGLQTRVGEKGVGLSVGQRQVICFARAMLANPKILILDEATSAIDTVTEARTQKALARLLAGRTSFLVAHRLSTITQCNLILVLEAGKIVEHGSHAVLSRQDGVYAALYRKFMDHQ